MKSTHAWVRHAETGGYWRCPVGALEAMAEKGWQPSDPPAPRSPATADALAWRAAQQAAQPKPTKTAARGKTTEGVSSDD
jgi:hypothetical protein